MPRGHGTAASTSVDSTTGAAVTPDTALSTGSAEVRSVELSELEKAAVAPSAERKLCASVVVLTANATAAALLSSMRRRPAAGTSVTAEITTAEADTFSVAAIEAESVAFCATPNVVLLTPPSVTLLEKVVWVALAKPGGFTVQATAPAAGLKEPGLHGWQSWLEEFRNVPAWQAVQPAPSALA